MQPGKRSPRSLFLNPALHTSAARLTPLWQERRTLTPLGNTEIEMLPSEVVRSLPSHAPVKPTRHSPHKTHRLQSAQKYTSLINGQAKLAGYFRSWSKTKVRQKRPKWTDGNHKFRRSRDNAGSRLKKKKTHKTITVLRETSRCVYMKQEQYVF